MRSFFGAITALSLRFRWVTLILAALVSVAGIAAITQLRQELIPSVEFPQTIILSQVSGMSSEQVLDVLTRRIEQALDEQVPEIVNLESSTTGSFGAVVTARNDFGQNQARIRRDVQAALDSIWLPTRQIAVPEGTDPQAFATSLLADVPPELLIYLEEQDPNFLFQLTPEVWSALSDETVASVLGYLANNTQAQSGAGGALRQLVDQEIVPLLDNLTEVASVSVGGGQLLPAADGSMPETTANEQSTTSLLLKLSPEVWAVASDKAGYDGAHDQAAVEALSANAYTVPDTAPGLPESWQMDHFSDARDLVEMRTLTRTLGAVLNNFLTDGRIVGSLGQTDDLTPEVIQQMLAIDPSLANYFKAEHLAAMSPEVFAALPADFIAGLDGFTRDELAARGLAASISGQEAVPAPVDLPAPWRISPPQIITFSFDDLPLATFAISGSMESPTTAESGSTTTTDQPAVEATPTAAPTATPELAQGPNLPLPFALIGGALGIELNTADDLVNLQLPENLSSQFGADTISAAQFLNFLLLLGNSETQPEGAPSLPIDPAALIGGISADAIQFLVDNDPTFAPNLGAEVFNAFSDSVLALDTLAPPLDSVWNTLANQPQFAGAPLRSAADIVALGEGVPSAALNAINAGVPAQFAGYEVRLFDSLTPGILGYFALREPEFYAAVSPDVLLKLSPETIAALPADALAALPADLQAQLASIASGATPSAAQALAELYTTNVPPADPNAPALNADWQFIGDFIGVELNSADDFTRFFPDTVNFLNNLFELGGRGQLRATAVRRPERRGHALYAGANTSAGDGPAH